MRTLAPTLGYEGRLVRELTGAPDRYGLDHGGTANAGPAGPAGKPATVAPELRRFFTA